VGDARHPVPAAILKADAACVGSCTPSIVAGPRPARLNPATPDSVLESWKNIVEAVNLSDQT